MQGSSGCDRPYVQRDRGGKSEAGQKAAEAAQAAHLTAAAELLVLFGWKIWKMFETLQGQSLTKSIASWYLVILVALFCHPKILTFCPKVPGEDAAATRLDLTTPHLQQSMY